MIKYLGKWTVLGLLASLGGLSWAPTQAQAVEILSVGGHFGLNMPVGFQYNNFDYSIGGGLDALIHVDGLHENDLNIHAQVQYMGYEFRKDPAVGLRIIQGLIGIEHIPTTSKLFIKPLLGVDIGTALSWLDFNSADNTVPNFGWNFVTEIRAGFVVDASDSVQVGIVAPYNLIIGRAELYSLGVHLLARIRL